MREYDVPYHVRVSIDLKIHVVNLIDNYWKKYIRGPVSVVPLIFTCFPPLRLTGTTFDTEAVLTHQRLFVEMISLNDQYDDFLVGSSMSLVYCIEVTSFTFLSYF